MRYRANGRRVTRPVESGRYRIVVPAHATRFLQLVVKVRRGAPRGLLRAFRVVAAAGRARSTMDVVKAKVRVVL